MNAEEKRQCPFAEYTEGYLKTSEYKEAWVKSFNETTREDILRTLELPHFNYELFEEISGISKGMIKRRTR